MLKSTLKYQNNRYAVSLPWKNEMRHSLTDNYQEAEKRIFSLTKRFTKDPVLYTQYRDILEEYEKEGIIETVDEIRNGDEPSYYLPHSPVIKQHRATTKVRIVFDASAHDPWKRSTRKQ